MDPPSKKKIPYPITPALRAYLRSHARENEMPVDYDSLKRFSEHTHCLDRQGRDTLWLTVTYPQGKCGNSATDCAGCTRCCAGRATCRSSSTLW